jgi:ParB-like chromosome segregation protein Spo0J
VLLVNVVASIFFWRPPVSAPREIKLVSVGKLHRNKRNCRTHSKKQVSQIANSIRRFGWTYPILTDENSIILAGHGRYDAALQLGLREVPIIELSGLKDAEKRALALADNQIASKAGWNRQLLAEELGDLATLLPECDLSLEITGFEAAEIDSLLGDLVDPERDPADEVPSPGKPQSAKSVIYGSSALISFYVATASPPRQSSA